MTLQVFIKAAILATGLAQPVFASCDPVEIQIGEQSLMAQRTDDGCVSDVTPVIERTPSGSARAPVFSELGVYIQVAAFGLPRNADKTIAKLAETGFGVWRQEFRSRKQQLDIIYVGPFENDEEANNALRTTRKMGFPDAFLRYQS